MLVKKQVKSGVKQRKGILLNLVNNLVKKDGRDRRVETVERDERVVEL